MITCVYIYIYMCMYMCMCVMYMCVCVYNVSTCVYVHVCVWYTKLEKGNVRRNPGGVALLT